MASDRMLLMSIQSEIVSTYTYQKPPRDLTDCIYHIGYSLDHGRNQHHRDRGGLVPQVLDPWDHLCIGPPQLFTYNT